MPCYSGKSASLIAVLAGISLLLLSGCTTSRRLPPINLNAPGWKVRQGQAIWKPDADKPEIVGDILLAQHPSGEAFVQFSKTLPIASARAGPRFWEIDFPPRQLHYSGHGNGPARVIWLQLLHALQGSAVPEKWSVQRGPDGSVTLSNTGTGENLEIHF